MVAHAEPNLRVRPATVAIVGRPNVGKSALFNRLIGQRLAIVEDTPGVTRDRLYALAEWRGRQFTFVDTGGIEFDIDPADAIAFGTREQAQNAARDADVIVFVVDAQDGLNPVDEDVAKILRNTRHPVLLVANKTESPSALASVHGEFARLGFGDPFPVSAIHGEGTGDLLDEIFNRLPPESDAVEPSGELAIALIGQPNVGKSSLLNYLVGAERSLVSSVAGTTRDAVDTLLEHRGHQVRLVDTAGIRRRGVVTTDIEHYSLLRAMRALERSDVALVVVDTSEGVLAQDRHIAGYAADAGKGVVVIANKWDLVPQEDRIDPETLTKISDAFDFVPGAPVLTVSALLGRNVAKVLDTALQVADARATRMPTAALNQVLREAVSSRPPAMHRGRRVKILYAAQASSPNPTVVLFVNDPELLHFSYQRYLENRIRAVFGFAGVRLHMVIRRRADSDG